MLVYSLHCFILIHSLPLSQSLLVLSDRFIRLLYGFLDVIEGCVEDASPPHREGISASPFPKLQSKPVEHLLLVLFLLVKSRVLSNALKSEIPQRLLDDILNALDKELLSLHITPPLLQDVSLLTHVVVGVHLRDNHPNAFGQLRVELLLQLIDFLQLGVQSFLCLCKLLLLYLKGILSVLYLHFLLLHLVFPLLDVCIQHPVFETALCVIKLVLSPVLHCPLHQGLSVLQILSVFFPLLKTPGFAHIVIVGKCISKHSLGLSGQ